MVGARVARQRAAVDGHQRALLHLSPRKVLQRGYSITTLAGDARPLRDAGAVRAGDQLLTRLARGELRSIVAKKPAGRAGGGPDSERGDRQQSLFDDGGGG